MAQPAPRILVVDDLDDHRELLSQVLVDLGYDVTAAGNGLSGLEAIRDGWLPDLVLVDLWMPVMDGAEFLLRLRAHPDRALARVPVVLMTADPGVVAGRTGDAPANLALEKPFGLKELRQAVVRFCGPGSGVARWGPLTGQDREKPAAR
jgi:CheY-like chemotaxis protein